MILSLIITWIFWIIIVIVDVIFHPQEWYLFLIPPIILSIIIVLLAQISTIACVLLTVCLHVLIVGELVISYLKK